jgi:RecJ-like exonuclease
MDLYKKFFDDLKEKVIFLKEIPKESKIKIISHHDSDGMSAAAIFIKFLKDKGYNFSLTIVPHLDLKTIDELSNESFDYFIFIDLGSNTLSYIDKNIHTKKILIFDHHNLENYEPKNIIMLNPHIIGLNDNREISSSGVVFFSLRNLDKNIESMAHIALIGAVGDNQENKGFKRLNQEILDIAIAQDKIKVIKNIRLFGHQTKPLFEVLKNSQDPYIPEITDSEENSMKFLETLGIGFRKDEEEYKYYSDLTSEEEKRLADAIIKRRRNLPKPDDIYWYNYILVDEKQGSPFRDIREFSTLLNASGRLNKSSLGIGSCLNDENSKKKATMFTNFYKREINRVLSWIRENKKTSNIVEEKGFVLIDGKDNIPIALVGTIASTLSYSRETKAGTIILTMAQSLETGKTKVSMRVAKSRTVNVFKILREICSGLDCEFGGHQNAAGAVLNTGLEDLFLENAKVILKKYSIEEKI